MTSEPVETTDRDRVLQAIRETIARHLELDVAAVPADARLLALPKVDSLRAMRGVLEIEARYGVTFDLGQPAVLLTVADLADLVIRAVEERQP